MQKYTRNRQKRKRRRSVHRKTRKQPVLVGGKNYTEYYSNDDIFLFNESLDIFGDPFSGPAGTSGASGASEPIYGKYSMNDWYQSGKTRQDKAEELAKENAPKTTGTSQKRKRGLIESVVEYINKKNLDSLNDARKKNPNSSEMFTDYPFILTIPEFKYKENNVELTVPSETVPRPVGLKSKDQPEPILPDDFLRFTKRSSVLNILFPFFMKVYISLLKDLNEDPGGINKDQYAENKESMLFVLKILREIHGFASPIWFNHIYYSAYGLGLDKYFKTAKMGYKDFVDKLNKTLAKTEETPIETTMFTFPSYANCENEKCKPDATKNIHTFLVQNGDFDESTPVDSLLNMYFFGKDKNTNSFSKLTNKIKKGPLRSLKKVPPPATTTINP